MNPMLKGVLSSAFSVAKTVGKYSYEIISETAKAAKQSFDETLETEEGQQLVADIRESLEIIRDDIHNIINRVEVDEEDVIECTKYTEYTIDAAKKKDDDNDKFSFNF